MTPGRMRPRWGVTVEEALVALLAVVAIVLLFLGLAEALEGDARARLGARRRGLARRARSRAPTGVASGERPALARRPAAGRPKPGRPGETPRRPPRTMCPSGATAPRP